MSVMETLNTRRTYRRFAQKPVPQDVVDDMVEALRLSSCGANRQAVFTSHRIFIVDMQGVTGTRQEIFVLPYRKIVHFGIQTAGFGDPLQTSELTVCYADEHEMKFGFIGQEELLAVAQAISRCIL